MLSSSTSGSLLVPNGSGGGGRERERGERQRTKSSPSPSPSRSRRSSASGDIDSILRRSPSPSLSSTNSPDAAQPDSDTQRPPGLRPALQRRPTSQTYLTTFPFPHPATSPDASAAEGGAWGWLTSTFRPAAWRVRRRSHASEGGGSAWEGSDNTATAGGTGTGEDTPLLYASSGAGAKRVPAQDAADPYGYRALAGPDLLPSFHAPRAQQARVQAGQSARRRFVYALLAALGVGVVLGLLGRLGVGVLMGAGWPGLGDGLG